MIVIIFVPVYVPAMGENVGVAAWFAPAAHKDTFAAATTVLYMNRAGFPELKLESVKVARNVPFCVMVIVVPTTVILQTSPAATVAENPLPICV